MYAWYWPLQVVIEFVRPLSVHMVQHWSVCGICEFWVSVDKCSPTNVSWRVFSNGRRWNSSSNARVEENPTPIAFIMWMGPIMWMLIESRPLILGNIASRAAINVSWTDIVLVTHLRCSTKLRSSGLFDRYLEISTHEKRAETLVWEHRVVVIPVLHKKSERYCFLGSLVKVVIELFPVRRCQCNIILSSAPISCKVAHSSAGCVCGQEEQNEASRQCWQVFNFTPSSSWDSLLYKW